MATKALLICEGPIPRGRPSDFTDEIADEICERIAAGETLTAICQDGGMPHLSTVARWLMRRPEFSQSYAHARETQAHVEAEQIRDIADNLALLPEHKKVMIGARQWRAERLNRRNYGNSTRHEHEVAVHPAYGVERLPPGVEWLAGRLQRSEERSEPDPGAMGEG